MFVVSAAASQCGMWPMPGSRCSAVAGGALSAWIVLAFMGCMGVILAMWDDTRPGLVYSLIWIVFIVGAAFANRHFLLRRASRGVLGDGGTGEGPHQGPHLHE